MDFSWKNIMNKHRICIIAECLKGVRIGGTDPSVEKMQWICATWAGFGGFLCGIVHPANRKEGSPHKSGPAAREGGHRGGDE